MVKKYVAVDTAPLLLDGPDGKTKIHLLWGDHVDVIRKNGDHSEVWSRGRKGFIENSFLGDESLLEVYFIDVGQGDGVLIRTPDDRHILIDGGFDRSKQPTRKNAADFVDWKFTKDYRKKQIHLDAMIASHCDADHYGGLFDLLDVAQTDELDAQSVAVDAFYHAGIGWWSNSEKKRWLGEKSADSKFFLQLLEGRKEALAALKPNAPERLQGEWARFIEAVTKAKSSDGGPTKIKRLSTLDEYIPEFADTNGLSIKILAPIQFDLEARPALRSFGSQDSWNTNGNSLLFRLDYGRARILLTGDLNSRCQKTLFEDYVGQRQEFECDVAKACHHGSDDVSYDFLAAMRPAVTVISSGDNEDHDHPRPTVVAASATTGYLQIKDDRILSPLVYSTELARSVSFGKPQKLEVSGAMDSLIELEASELSGARLTFTETKAGQLKSKTVTRNLKDMLVVAGQIYGLVNVRTNGEKILCATLNEGKQTWQIKTINSRF